MSVVITEGIIGVGKTTFSERLAEHLKGEWLREPDETNGNVYLSKFYADAKRWAFTMQLHLLNMRYRMHQSAQWYSMQTKKNVVLDRSYFGDTAFARLQLKNETMTKDEYNTYTMCYHNMTATVLLPQFCVYLKADPKVAQNRVHRRMEIQTGRKCEKSIDLEYLEELAKEEKIVIETLEKQGVKIIELDWNEDRSYEEINKIAEEVAEKVKSFEVPDMLQNYHRRTC